MQPSVIHFTYFFRKIRLHKSFHIKKSTGTVHIDLLNFILQQTVPVSR